MRDLCPHEYIPLGHREVTKKTMTRKPKEAVYICYKLLFVSLFYLTHCTTHYFLFSPCFLPFFSFFALLYAETKIEMVCGLTRDVAATLRQIQTYYHQGTMATLISWNVKGLRSPHKRGTILRRLKKLRVDIAMLLETHLT